jgi:hypothetical protein
MYQEFRIKIERRGRGGFEVSASGPAGEVEGTFRVPLGEKDLRLLILEMGVPRAAVRGLDAPAAAAARELGDKLYRALFSGDVGLLFLRSRELAEAQGDRLRVTLALTDVPTLMHFPWEYLYDGESGRFLAVSVRTPVVRYLEVPSQRRPMLVKPPLAILGMVSSPADVTQLDSGVERENLERALADLKARGLVEITWLETASLDALQDELRGREYHVFHYVGHGGFDPREDRSVLLLEGASERARYASGEQIGTVLFDHTSLRLAVLNACEAARTSTRNPFAGVAESLVRQEIPAVIAMQFPITDAAAITFSSEFYRALADGLPVDAAMAEARKAMYAADPDNVEWGTPVLFMRVADGRVFELDRSAVQGAESHEAPRARSPEAPPDGDGGGGGGGAPPPPEGRPALPRPSLPGRLRRRPLPVLAVAAVLGVAATLGIVLAGGNGSHEPASATTGRIADIPGEYLTFYRQAAARYGIDWAVLAAIGKIECDHGRDSEPGCNPPGTVGEGGVTGPMAFLGSTWRAGTPEMGAPEPGPPTMRRSDGYATDGDGDGVADVWNPADAIAGAARLLHDSGAPADYLAALRAYSADQAFVDSVLAKAREYREASAGGDG